MVLLWIEMSALLRRLSAAVPPMSRGYLLGSLVASAVAIQYLSSRKAAWMRAGRCGRCGHALAAVNVPRGLMSFRLVICLECHAFGSALVPTENVVPRQVQLDSSHMAFLDGRVTCEGAVAAARR